MAKAIIELKESINKIEFYLNQYELKALEGRFIREGKWLIAEDNGSAVCSECGDTVYFLYKFCPNCGARMSE